MPGWTCGLCRDYGTVTVKAPAKEPCPLGSARTLTVVHMVVSASWGVHVLGVPRGLPCDVSPREVQIHTH